MKPRNSKTHMEQALKQSEQAVRDAVMAFARGDRVYSSISHPSNTKFPKVVEDGVHISVKGDITNIEINGVHLPFCSGYSAANSEENISMMELKLELDIVIGAPAGYQFTDNGGCCSLLLNGTPIDYQIKSYSLNPIARGLIEMVIIFLIPKHCFHVDISRGNE